MATHCPSPSGCETIPAWSTNGMLYNGLPVGDAEHDVARRLRETTPEVAKWANRPPFPGATCKDVAGWKDELKYGCDWYEENDNYFCPDWRDYPGSAGLTAGQACCHCGGK